MHSFPTGNVHSIFSFIQIYVIFVKIRNIEGTFLSVKLLIIVLFPAICPAFKWLAGLDNEITRQNMDKCLFLLLLNCFLLMFFACHAFSFHIDMCYCPFESNIKEDFPGPFLNFPSITF